MIRLLLVGIQDSMPLNPLGDSVEHTLKLSHLRYEEAVFDPHLPSVIAEAAHRGCYCTSSAWPSGLPWTDSCPPKKH